MSSIWDEADGTPPSVLVAAREGVAVVTLNRPQRMNAWTKPMGELYFDTLERLASDEAVKAILVIGEGRGFCAGVDLGGLARLADADRPATVEKPSRPYYFPMTVGKPIVAAIHGPCLGVGLQQALCCDIRFASEDARFAAPYARRGLIGEVGMTWSLTRLIGLGPATELMLSGRTLDASEALRIGLVSRVVPDADLVDVAFTYCKDLADQCSPWSMRAIKSQLLTDLTNELPTAYARSQALMTLALARTDVAEGVGAFRDKRKPSFVPLDASDAMIELAKDGV